MSKIRRGAEAGVSIIEVLVAIAILTIGMLAILILFPAGLVTLQTSANSTNADRLGQAELEKASTSQVQLIGAIYANDNITANANPLNFLQSTSYQISDPGNPPTSTYVSNATTTNLSNATDVDAFRSIVGETIRVPSLNAQDNSIYTVIAGPIESSSLTVLGTPWHGTSGDSTAGASDYLDPALLTPNQPAYYIDYANQMIAVSPEPYAQTFWFTVTDTSGNVISQPITFPKTYSGIWQTLAQLGVTLTTSNPWSKGTDSLVPQFTNMTSVPNTGFTNNFDSDPYEYELYTADYTPGSGPAANLGVIAFNPLISTNNMHGADGKPLEAVLNYRTFDWHIISEDRQIDSTTGTVRLSLINLLADTAKDVLSDNVTKFTGLFDYSGSTGTDPDFIILDMDTGYVLNSVQGTTDYTVNYPSGTVSFVNGSGEYANDHLRIFYHPEDDWAVALARAPVVYSQVANSTTPPLSCYSQGSGQSYQVLYFPLADINKQVDIRFLATVGTSQVPIDGLYTIFGNGSGAEVDLSGMASGSPTLTVSLPQNTTAITPISVKGVSLSAIVIWKDNGIWHNRTLSTVLPSLTQTSPTSLQ